MATKGLTKNDSVNPQNPTSQLTIQAQTTCEIEMLDEIGAHEVFSGEVQKC